MPDCGWAGLYSCVMLEMPGTCAATRGMARWCTAALVVSGLGLRDGDVAATGDGDGVRTSGESGLLCHDLRRLAALALVTASLCFNPCSELGRPPTAIGDGDPVTAGDPGALDPGELLCDDELPVECAESDIHDSTAATTFGCSRDCGTPVVGEFGMLSLDESDKRCGESGEEVVVSCCSAALRLLN